MLINTHTKESMEFDICDYFSVSVAELAFLFSKAGAAACKENYLNGDIFNAIIYEFIDTHVPVTPVDHVLFFHLARRLDSSQNDFTGRNLADLLTTKNVFSDFLKNHDVEFLSNNGHLDLYHRGELVSLENTYESNVPYLRARLGYNKGREDYCFNGFLLKDRLYKNHYARELSDVPEFVGILATFLKRRDIGTDYYQNSTYYCLEYCTPLEKVLFDDNDKLSLDEKRKYLLNKIMWRLYDYTDFDPRYAFDHDNPILRLRDDDDMESEYFIASEIITDELLK
jgi:hypothetical protein